MIVVNDGSSLKVDVAKLIASGMGVVIHGTTAGMARPTGYAVVTWIGTIQPTNAATDDIWYNG